MRAVKPDQAFKSQFIALTNDLADKDENVNLIALQDLCEVLSIANQDFFTNLDTQKACKSLIGFVQSKTAIMHAELLLLSCRCLFNLFEAHPQSVSLILKYDGVEALVDKLMEIEYIDLAEQILKVLERVSQEYPYSIMKSRGMLAAIQYLDFFGIHAQRIAITILVNSCDALTPRSKNCHLMFEMVGQVLDCLVHVLGYSDSKMTDLSAQALAKISIWASHDPLKFAQLFTNDLLKILVDRLSVTHQSNSDDRASVTHQSNSDDRASVTHQSNSDDRASVTHQSNSDDRASVTHQSKQGDESNKKIQSILSILALVSKTTRSSYLIIDLDFLSVIKNIIEMGINTRPIEHICSLLATLGNILPPLPIFGVWRIDPLQSIEQEIQPSADQQTILKQCIPEILPLLLDIFIHKNTMKIRKCVVGCISKIIYHGSPFIEAGFDKGQKIGTVVYELINYHRTCMVAVDTRDKSKTMVVDHDARLFVYAGCAIATLILEKFELSVDFSRRGVQSELEGLSAKSGFTGLSNDALMGRSSGVDIITMIKDSMGQSELNLGVGDVEMLGDEDEDEGEEDEGCGSEGDDDECETGSVSNKYAGVLPDILGNDVDMTKTLDAGSKAVIQREALQKYAEKIFAFRNVDRSQLDYPGWTSERFSEAALFKKILSLANTLLEYFTKDLKSIELSRLNYLQARIIKNGSSVDCNLVDIQRDLVEIMGFVNDPESSMTNYEIFSGSIIEFMIDFLTSTNDCTHNFLRLSDQTQWRLPLKDRIELMLGFKSMHYLCTRIRECMTRSDNYPLMYPSPQSRQSMFYVASQLTRQIRILLKCEGLPDTHVSIPAASSFKTLEVYIKSRDLASGIIVDDQDIEMGDDDLEEGVALSPTTLSKLEHVYFMINETIIDSNSTIFGSIYHSMDKPANLNDVWTKVHVVTFQRNDIIQNLPRSIPLKVGRNCICAICNQYYFNLKDGCDDSTALGKPLVLLKLLYELFPPPLSFLDNFDDILIKQIGVPLLSVSGIHPNWVWNLMSQAAFLFSFEARLLFLRTSRLGYSSNMSTWMSTNNHQDTPKIRNDKTKVKIDREYIFEGMTDIWSLSHCEVLDIEFVDEVGSGLGPTAEFFALVSEKIRSDEGVRFSRSDPRVMLWRDARAELYPRPTQNVYADKIFKCLGWFTAKAILDARVLDVSFNQLFLSQVFKFSEHDGLAALKDATDIESIMLDFTLPGYPDFELIPGGKDILVDENNLSSYIDAIVDATVGSGILSLIKSFRIGFHALIAIDKFNPFSIEEIGQLIEGEDTGSDFSTWAVPGLRDAINTDHGYNHSSRTTCEFFNMLSEFTKKEQRLFLAFCTGCPRLPIGGFYCLEPRLTIVYKAVIRGECADDCLPSVMTCAHYLKVPEYSCPSVMKSRFLLAMSEGSHSFHLS